MNALALAASEITLAQLFDLQGDPGEQHDVAAKHTEMVARLRKQYDSIANSQSGQ